MSIHIICSGNAGTDFSVSTAGNAFLVGHIHGTSQHIATPVAVACTLRDWYLEVGTAPGVGNGRTYTIQKNDVDTALVITISGTALTGSITGVNVSFALGDTVRMKVVNTGTPAATTHRSAIICEPVTAEEYLYAWSAASIARTFIMPLGGAERYLAGVDEQAALVSVPGTITRWYYRERTAPGGAGTRTVVLLKNGVAQDGSGGTPDTRLTLSGATATTSASFALTVAAGDLLVIQQSTTGSPTASSWATGSLCFVPTDAGRYVVSGSGTQTTTGASSYAPPHGSTSTNYNFNTVESNRRFIAHGSESLAFGTFWVSLGGAPSAGQSRTFTLYVNSSPTTLTVTIANPATSASLDVATPVTIAPGDTWVIHGTTTAAPGSASQEIRWSLGAPAPSTAVEQAQPFVWGPI